LRQAPGSQQDYLTSIQNLVGALPAETQPGKLPVSDNLRARGVFLLLRLYLDQNEGVASIRCPHCTLPLLPAAERMGHMVVAYGGGFVARAGAQVLLVCPSYECDYQEPVEIARKPQDAVVFSTCQAASRWQMRERVYERSIGEIRQEIERLIRLHDETGNPKLPAAIKVWSEQLGFSQYLARDYTERSYRDDCEIWCQTTTENMRGKVKALMHDGVLFERASDGKTVLIQLADIYHVTLAGLCTWSKQRFDFRDDPDNPKPGNVPQFMQRRFIVYGGQTLCFDGVTKHGICRAHTKDPAVARTLGLPLDENSAYHGEFPVVLVERYYHLVRYCWVKGHRLHMTSLTRDPDVFQLATRSMEAARELRMRRNWTWCGQREALRWHRFFDRQEIENEVDVEITLRLRTPRRRR